MTSDVCRCRSLMIIAFFLLPVFFAGEWTQPTSAEEAPPRKVLGRVIPDGADPGGLEFVQLFELTGFSGPVYSLDWSPDGTALASAAYGMIMIWDPITGQVEAVVRGHQSFVWGVAWSPDGRLLATASSDRTVKLWRPPGYQEVASLDTGSAMCVAWSPDGQRLAVGTRVGSVSIWDVPSRTIDRQLSGSSLVISADWSGDGLTLATGDLAGTIALWDPDTGRLLARLDPVAHRSDTNGLTWSPDDTLLATAHQDGGVWLWDAHTREPLHTLVAHRGWARGVAFSPDGRLLVTTGENDTAVVWSTETWEPVADLRIPPLAMWSASWAPDGSRFAVGSGRYDSLHSGSVYVWEVLEGS